MRVFVSSFGLLAVCLLCACSTAPTQTVLVSMERVEAVSQVPLPSAEGLSVEEVPTGDVPAGEASPDEWWAELEDTSLNNLVLQGVAQSLDIAKAAARIREADAVLRAAKAPLWPGLSFAANSVESSGPSVVTEFGGRLGWQVDLFGRARLSANAASARRDAVGATADDVQRTVAADIVALYIGIRATEADLRLSEESLVRLHDAEDKITRLTEAGYATQLDVDRTLRQRLDVEARTYTLRGQLVAQRNALSLLMGEGPGGVVLPETATPFPAAPPSLSAPDVPQIIARRPDLRAAHANLIAAAKDASVSRRKVLPSLDFSLTSAASDAGRSALSLGGFQSQWALDLASPILFRGEHLAGIDRADARLSQVAIEYERTALKVLSDVDTALAQTQTLTKAAKISQASTEAAGTALTQSRRLFDAGEIAYLDVLLAEQAQIEADRSVLALRRDALLAWARFMSAQGG